MERRYWFIHGKRQVYIVAGSVEFAKEKFQVRWGYWPQDPIRID